MKWSLIDADVNPAASARRAYSTSSFGPCSSVDRE
jgi:hypothetical protein